MRFERALPELGGIAHSVAVTATAETAARVASFGTAVIAARSLGPLLFGEYAVLLASGVVAVVIWDLGYSTQAAMKIAALQIGQRTALESVFRKRIAALGIVITAYIVLAFALGHVPLTSWLAASVFLVAATGSGMTVGVGAVLRGVRRFGHAALATAVGRWATMAFSLVSFTTPDPNLGLVIIAGATVVGELIALGASLLAARPVLGRDSREDGKLTWREAWPLAFGSVLTTGYNRLDVILLGFLSSATAVAVYAPASRFQDAMYFFPGAIGLVSLPALAGMSVQGRDLGKVVGQIWLGGLAIALPVAIAVFIFADKIIVATLGAPYSGSEVPLRVVVASLPLAVVGAPLVNALIAQGDSRKTVGVVGSAFLAAIVIHWLLDPAFGATGAAVASLLRDVVYVVAALAVFELSRRARTSRSG